jgi:hypothetical protein
MRKKILLYILLTLSLIALFGSCGFNTANSDDTTPQPASSAQNSPSASPEPEQNSPTSAPESESTPAPSPDGVLSVDIDGKNVEIAALKVTGGLRAELPLSFEMFIDSKNYMRTEDDTVFRYAYSGDGTGGTFIEISLISGTTSEDIAPSFLNDYIDFTGIEFSSYTRVGRDALSGYKISADNSSLYTEAYLIDTEGDVAALVISCSKEYSDECLPYLNSMLNTFAFTE